MNRRDAMEVAIKVIGLHSLFTFAMNIVAQASTICAAFSLLGPGHQEAMTNPILYILIRCLSPLLQLAFAVVFLRAGGRLAEMLVGEPSENAESEMTALVLYDRYLLWIRILGLYFFVAGVVHLASRVGILFSFFLSGGDWQRYAYEFAPALQLAFSLILICKAPKVAHLIGQKYNRNGVNSVNSVKGVKGVKP